MKYGIATYARVRPLNEGQVQNYTLRSKLENGHSIISGIDFVKQDHLQDEQDLHQQLSSDEIQSTTYGFEFTQIFNEQASQEQVFEIVCKQVLMDALKGINATFFAYGQTGSGKTFTMTGGNQYQERGILPRALTTIYDYLHQQEPNLSFSCDISYVQIYNEAIYDLLNRSNMNLPIEEWTKVQLRDDQDGEMHFYNLDVYEANTEEDALKLLFLGNVNRVTSATPMNLASSRSHAIFTMLLQTKALETGIVTSCKIHFVDLAGSERVYKHHLSDKLRREGKTINLSLHFLEQVVRSLSSVDPQHIPYRNSMLTSVLKGSLGGNCKTVFIATLNPEMPFLLESISTCRFMARCSQVQVQIQANTTLDPEVQIQTLKKQNQLLQHKLRQLQETQIQTSSITLLPSESEGEADEDECEDFVEQFLACTQDTDKHAEILNAMKGKGKRTMGLCIELLKCNVVYASEALAQLRQEYTTLCHNYQVIASEMHGFQQQNEHLTQQNHLLQMQAQDVRAFEPPGFEVEAQSTSSEEDESNVKEEEVEEQDKDQIQQPPPQITTIENESPESTIRRHLALLKKGALFLKHGRRGKPHVRFVNCTKDLKYLQYRSLGNTKTRALIPISAITKVHPGRRRLTNATKGCEYMCLSIEYGKDRFLDLQVDYGDDIRTNHQLTKDWIDAFIFLIQLTQAQEAPLNKAPATSKLRRLLSR